MLKVIENEVESENEFRTQLDALVREGARRMLMLAVKAEADEYVERFADVRDESGRKLVVRNGKAKKRTVTTGAGPLDIEAPRVNDKRVIDGERQKLALLTS